MRKSYYMTMAVAVAMCLTSCSDDEPNNNGTDPKAPSQGLYILCEGNMGSNSATLDYVDFLTSNTITTGIYNAVNGASLGDTGSDLAYSDGYLYAVVNGSNKVEKIDAETVKSTASVSITSPRQICINGNYAYVTSYSDGEEGRGSVKEISLANFSVTRSLPVSYEPEGMAVVDGKLYVANSCGLHLASTDDSYVSVIDLGTFKEVSRLKVGTNTEYVKADSKNRLWVTSRGNYADIPSRLYMLERDSKGEMAIAKTFNFACSNLAIGNEKLYYYASEWSNVTFSMTITFGTIDLNTLERGDSFIADKTLAESLYAPYSILVNRNNNEIYLTDAGDYVSSGQVFCFDKEGKELWRRSTGAIPGHLVLIPKK